jgi:hypothetical protein
MMGVAGGARADAVAQRIGGDAERGRRRVEEAAPGGDEDAPAAIEGERHDAGRQNDDTGDPARVDRLVEKEQGHAEGRQRRRAAHQRVDFAELTVVVGQRQKRVVAEVNDCRGEQERPSLRRQDGNNQQPGQRHQSGGGDQQRHRHELVAGHPDDRVPGGMAERGDENR